MIFMAHRRSKDKGKSEEYAHNQLSLAEKWAKQLGNKVNIGEISLKDGSKIPILAIDHGGKLVLISEEDDTINIVINIDVPEEVRKKIGAIDKDTAHKMLISLQNQLMSNARTAYMMNPNKFKNLSEVKTISIQQRIKISAKDSCSFNRFADAIQEVVTVAVKAMLIYGIISNTQSTSGDQKPLQPPDSMYA